MNASLRHSSGRIGLLATSRLIVVCVTLFGASGNVRAQEVSRVDESAAPTQRSVKVSEAVALALSDRASEAEAALATSLRHAPDSALGQLELASRLVRVAIECAANGKTEAADLFASRALERLAATRKLATDREAGAVASAWQLVGFVQLDFRGDREAALAAYREAAALAPDDDLVRRKIDWLEKQQASATRSDEGVTP